MKLQILKLVGIMLIAGFFNQATAQITTFPFTEGFETPSGWTNEHVQGVKGWEYQNGGGSSGGENPTSAHGGSLNVCFYNDEYNPERITKFVSPQLDMSGLTDASLTFWHTQEKRDIQDELKVYYKTSATGAWVLLDAYTSDIQPWTKEIIVLPNLSDDYYIAFEGASTGGGWGWGVCVDDVLIQEGYPTINTFPFTEDFETPSGWTNEFVDYSRTWAYQNGGETGGAYPSSAHGGNQNICLYNPSTTAHITKFVSPKLDLSSLSGASLTFWHTQYGWGGNQDELKVYYKTSEAGTWVLLETYSDNISSWTKEKIYLPNLSNDYYIAFEGIAKYGHGVCVDDIEVALVINSFPYDEDFEGGAGSTHWENVYSIGTQDWAFQNGGGSVGGEHPASAHGGSKNICLRSVTTKNTKYESPQIDFTGLSSATLTFWHTQDAWSINYQDVLNVWYKSSSSGIWQMLASYSDEIEPWTQETITLPEISDDYYIRFSGNANNGYGVCIDDVQISGNTITPAATVSEAIGCGTGSVTVSSDLTGTQTFYLRDNSGGAIDDWTGDATSHEFTGLNDGIYKGQVKKGTQISALSSAVTLTNNIGHVAPTSVTATNSEICLGESTTLSYNGGSGNTFEWFTASCGGTSVGTGDDLTASPTTTTTYYGRWETSSCGVSTCESVTITVSTTPVAPTSVSATSITITSGESTTLSYTGGSGDTFKWYSASCGGTFVGNGNDLTVSPTVTTTYYGLWENSCGVSTCESITINVTTYCPSYSVPYSQDFEEATFLPDCWTKDIPNANNDITQSSTQNHTSGGTYSARFSSYSSSSDYNQYLYSPSFVIPANCYVSFWHRKHNTSSENLEWGVATTTNSNDYTWTSVSLSDTEWQETIIDLSAYEGQTIHIGFHYYASFQYYVYFDDFNIYTSTNPTPVATLSATPGCETGSVTVSSDLSGNQTFYLRDNSGVAITDWTGDATSHEFTGLNDGTYKGQVEKDGEMSVLSGAVVLTNNANPIAPTSVSATATTITSGESTTLSYTGGSGETFNWYSASCGGTYVGTGNDLTVSPTVTTTYYGRWETTSCGESTCESITITVAGEANVNNISSSAINIYPNPTNGIITIESESQKMESIEITDITGKIIRQFSVNSKQLSVNLNSEEKGVYFIRINQANKTLIAKVIMK